LVRRRFTTGKVTAARQVFCPAEALLFLSLGVVSIVKMLSISPKVITGERETQSTGDRFKMEAGTPNFYPAFS
jgi:hypothetical protein